MLTYRDGWERACRILEFYLWFNGKKIAESSPLWHPYIELRGCIHALDSRKPFVWDGAPLPIKEYQTKFNPKEKT